MTHLKRAISKEQAFDENENHGLNNSCIKTTLLKRALFKELEAFDGKKTMDSGSGPAHSAKRLHPYIRISISVSVYQIRMCNCA